MRGMLKANVFGLIEAAVGTSLPGFFAQPPAREIPRAVETKSWDSGSLERCHEIYETKTNRFVLVALLFVREAPAILHAMSILIQLTAPF